MDEQLFFSSTSSSLFDTYLVYGIIGLLILIAIVGLIILLSTSCCCCSSLTSCSSCCFRHHRHSSYKLRQRAKRSEGLGNGDSKKIAFIRRHPSDVADFSQLYDSCPHLINSKAMTPTRVNMDTSCTTIDTLVSPVSPCSSFRSFIEPGTVVKDITLTNTQNDLGNVLQQNHITAVKTNNAPVSCSRGACSRPFSYIKNTNDRAQILRRFTPQERSVPVAAVAIDVTRIPTPEHDHHNSINLNSPNIYETVLPTTLPTNNDILSDISVPIYETEWTHNLRQLMMPTTTTTTTGAPIEKNSISVIELPSAPPDLISSTEPSSDYFQQENPYGKFLASRTTTSDSMRRANMLRRLKDDAAFLY